MQLIGVLLVVPSPFGLWWHPSGGYLCGFRVHAHDDRPPPACFDPPGMSGKLWATFVPLSNSPPPEPGARPKGISIIARDTQSVFFYDSEGKFAGVRRPGSGKAIAVDGVNFVVDNIVSSTGLELKSDPGVPMVYAGKGRAHEPQSFLSLLLLVAPSGVVRVSACNAIICWLRTLHAYAVGI